MLLLRPFRATAHGVVSMRGNGFLSLWIDWNRDGDFADAGEQILNNVSRTAGSDVWLKHTVAGLR